MDEIQILLYILFIVIAVLSRAFSKKKKQSQGTPPSTASGRPSSRTEAPPKKPVSFEDLLREFTGEAETTSIPEIPEYENDLRDDYDQSPASFDDSSAAETYRKSIDQAKDLKTLDETVDLEDIQIGSGRFDEFKILDEDEGGDLNEYLEVFNDLEGSRKAIVLSEILQRKY